MTDGLSSCFAGSAQTTHRGIKYDDINVRSVRVSACSPLLWLGGFVSAAFSPWTGGGGHAVPKMENLFFMYKERLAICGDLWTAQACADQQVPKAKKHDSQPQRSLRCRTDWIFATYQTWKIQKSEDRKAENTYNASTSPGGNWLHFPGEREAGGFMFVADCKQSWHSHRTGAVADSFCIVPWGQSFVQLNWTELNIKHFLINRKKALLLFTVRCHSGWLQIQQ